MFIYQLMISKIFFFNRVNISSYGPLDPSNDYDVTASLKDHSLMPIEGQPGSFAVKKFSKIVFQVRFFACIFTIIKLIYFYLERLVQSSQNPTIWENLKKYKKTLEFWTKVTILNRFSILSSKISIGHKNLSYR